MYRTEKNGVPNPEKFHGDVVAQWGCSGHWGCGGSIWGCGGSIVSAPDFWGRGLGLESGVSHNDPGALQDHCVVL